MIDRHVVGAHTFTDVSGELVRSDITDGEPGVPLFFDVQLIDTNTCKPIPNVALEAWYANSTVRIKELQSTGVQSN